MPQYRQYKLDGAGNIVSAEWLEASDDSEALRIAGKDGGPSEVWQGKRLVGRIGTSFPPKR